MPGIHFYEVALTLGLVKGDGKDGLHRALIVGLEDVPEIGFRRILVGSR